MNAAIAIVRLALLAYPRAFRREFGGDIVADHEAILRDRGLAPFARSLIETLCGGIAMRAERAGGETALAVRRLRRHPGFAAAVIATFAIGVGVNVAVFSVLSALVFAPSPMANIRHLALVTVHPPAGPAYGLVGPDHVRAFAKAPFTDSIAAFFPSNQRVMTNTATQVYGLTAYPGMLDTLGIRPELGSAREAGIPGRAAISDEFWRSHFGADPSIIGRAIVIDGKDIVVAAVLPPHLMLPMGFGREIPFQLLETVSVPAFLASGAQSDVVIVKYKPGWSIRDVDRMVRTIAAGIRTNDAAGRNAIGTAVDVRSAMLGPDSFYAWALFWATAAVLLIACVNAATLVLAFTLTRTNEFALRRELGAGPANLLGQLLAEAAVLALPGTAAGVALAVTLVQPLTHVLFTRAYNVDRAHVDAAALAYSVGVAVVAVLAAALTPYMHFAQRRSSALRGAGLGMTLRSALVVAEIGAAFALIFSTALLARDVFAIANQPLGIDPSHVAVTAFPFTEAGFSDAGVSPSDEHATLARLSALPGVTSAAVSMIYPLSTSTVRMPIGISDQPISASSPIVSANAVSSQFFATLGIPIVLGRPFSAGDDSVRAAPVAIVDKLFVDRYLRGRNPIGMRIQIPSGSKPYWSRIIGVAGTVRDSLSGDPTPAVYVPYEKAGFGMFYSMVRGTLPSDALARELGTASYPRMHGHRVDTRTFASIVAEQTANQRAIAELFGALALIAALLALTGIYGVIAFSVRRRTREFGIRLALGASGASIMRGVMRRVAVMVAAGIGVGLILSVFAQRLLAPNLSIVKGFDFPTLLIAAVSMLAVALVAGIIPAQRAMRIDPAASLRYE